MLANSQGHAGGHRGGLRELRGPCYGDIARGEGSRGRGAERRRLCAPDGRRAGEVLKGLSTKGVEVDSAAFMFLGVNLLQIC